MDLASPDLAGALEAATADLDLGVLVYNAAFVPVGRFLDADADAPGLFTRLLPRKAAIRLMARNTGDLT